MYRKTTPCRNIRHAHCRHSVQAPVERRHGQIRPGAKPKNSYPRRQQVSNSRHNTKGKIQAQITNGSTINCGHRKRSQCRGTPNIRIPNKRRETKTGHLGIRQLGRHDDTKDRERGQNQEAEGQPSQGKTQSNNLPSGQHSHCVTTRPTNPRSCGHLYSHGTMDAQIGDSEVLSPSPGLLRPDQRSGRHRQEVPRRSPSAGFMPYTPRRPRTRRGATRVQKYASREKRLHRGKYPTESRGNGNRSLIRRSNGQDTRIHLHQDNNPWGRKVRRSHAIRQRGNLRRPRGLRHRPGEGCRLDIIKNNTPIDNRENQPNGPGQQVVRPRDINGGPQSEDRNAKNHTMYRPTIGPTLRLSNQRRL